MLEPILVEVLLMLMFDSGTFDKLAGEPDSFFVALRAAVKARRLCLFITHKQEADDIARIPSEERRKTLRAMMTTTGEENGQLINLAWLKGATLVTNDDRMKSRALLLDMKVWDYAKFRVQVAR